MASDDKKKKTNVEEIKKIKSSSFSRGLSVLNMTVSTGVKLVGYKLGEVFADEDGKGARRQNFLSEQATTLVKEFGKLKGSFMKAGQMLSVYGEYYLPPEVNLILKKLQSESSPVSWDSMEKVIRNNLGDEIFEILDIDPSPVSAASMGQVYKAVRRSDGKILALKVQYPGVDKAIDNDLRAMRSILSLSKLVPTGPAFDEIFSEVRMMLKHESDYKRELAQIQKFHELLEGDDRYVIPEVLPEFSTKRVLCMSFEEGIPIDSEEVVEFSQKRRNMIGSAVMDLMFHEMFNWRLVQTDCHFGNFKIREGDDSTPDKLILFDFGAIRKFSKKYMDPFSKLVFASMMHHSEDVVRYGLEMGFLLEGDPEEHQDLFVDLCFTAIVAFDEAHASPSLDGSDAGENPYRWGETDLIDDLSNMARSAVFAFKFRPPPRESIFLNRKMVGTYFFLRKINYEFGPRKIMMRQVDPDYKD